jgi:hypothetical protein
MSTQPVVIKVWCRSDDLQRTANLLAWTIGHRVEIPLELKEVEAKNKYLFVITDIEQYDDANMVRSAMGFDIIGKVSGVIAWEVMPKEQLQEQLSAQKIAEDSKTFVNLLDDLPIPISIIQQLDGTYAWKWLRASGQSATYLDAVKAALSHVMKSYALIRSELMG